MMCDNVLPLQEGKCPPVFDKEREEWYYPEPEEYDDPEIVDEKEYRVDDKDEFYDYSTVCKSCGTQFIAYSETRELIRNYCPGCGKCLDIPPEE